MKDERTEKLFARGLGYLDQGQTLSALACFEKALHIEDNPAYYSYLALCIAKERGQIRKAISLSEEAIQRDPQNPAHYLNLGKIYLHTGDKEYAVTVFREGLQHGTDQQILEELAKLQTRKPSVIPFLSRDNPINKYLGMLFKFLRIR